MRPNPKTRPIAHTATSKSKERGPKKPRSASRVFFAWRRQTIVRQIPHDTLKKRRVRRNLRVTRRGRMMASNASQRTTRKIARPARKTPGAGIMCALYLLRLWRRKRGLRFEFGGDGYFRFEKFGDRTAGFGVLYGRVEFRFVRAGNFGNEVQMAFGDGKAVADFFEGNGGRRLELFSNHA